MYRLVLCVCVFLFPFSFLVGGSPCLMDFCYFLNSNGFLMDSNWFLLFSCEPDSLCYLVWFRRIFFLLKISFLCVFFLYCVAAFFLLCAPSSMSNRTAHHSGSVFLVLFSILHPFWTQSSSSSSHTLCYSWGVICLPSLRYSRFQLLLLAGSTAHGTQLSSCIACGGSRTKRLHVVVFFWLLCAKQ